MEFSVSHLRDASFEGGGLRNFFEYRNLVIAKSTGGKVGAHVIRAVAGTRHRRGTPPSFGLSDVLSNKLT